MEVFLVRHGQAAFGSDDYDRLSDLGREQSALVGRYFSECGMEFDRVFSGTQRRHRETLEAMSPKTSSDISVSETEGLNEYDLRDIIRCWHKAAIREKKTHDNHIDAFYHAADSALNAWTCDQLTGAKESWNEFNDRVLNARNEIISSSADRVLVITSGGPIGTLLRDALQLPPPSMIRLNLELANASITKLVLKGKQQRLVCFNSISHLEINGEKSLVSLL